MQWRWYIVSDNPEIGCDEAIERSMAMMRGHRMRLSLMQLGMVGWSLLSLLTPGIAGAVDSPLLPNCLREFLP